MKFNFHDLIANGILKPEGSIQQKQMLSGHKTESQVVAYDRLIKVTRSLDSHAKVNSSANLRLYFSQRVFSGFLNAEFLMRMKGCNSLKNGGETGI
ncbi:site-specific integrase [Biostraticola tofi]|uniref:hypothetical protein n=1 Tax=Biostraticola tofi TaxID=466109 RepID=UPI001049F2AD|nr:hypothetical protein [Biostraticola tofi]